MKVTDKDIVDIIDAYQNELVPMIELASRYNMTRQGIHKILRRAGVNTALDKIPVSCTACDKEFVVPRCRMRRSKHLFCCQECYTAWLQAGSRYQHSRCGMRFARNKVAEWFSNKRWRFVDSYIIHHKDGNNYNNQIHNLMVFKNQGDHIRHHRGFTTKPVWDGSNPDQLV